MDSSRETTNTQKSPFYSNSEFGRQVSEEAHHLKDQTVDAYQSSLALVRRNPVSIMFSALGVGLILGFLFRGK
jgi:hypothetical protein